MKKRTKMILVAAILVALGAGGYFLVRHFGVFSGRQAVYSQQKNSVTELAQEKVISNQSSVTNDQEKENIAAQSADEQPESKDQQVEISNQEDNAISNQPSVTNNKSTDKNADDNKSTDTKTMPGKIVSKFVSWGFQKSSGRSIKAVIVHTSYNAIGGDVFDFDKVMQEWKDAGVSPHYTIDRDGTIYQLVSDQNIAWHAGSSKLPDGTTDVNGVSIGIEVINSQDAKFTDDQYGALNYLIATLKKKYSIKYVLGHDDIAPGRKSDPWNIDWGKVKR